MVPQGIPHSAFLGWDRDDQDKALAWHKHERERCQMCGTHESDWEVTRFPYETRLHICKGCEHLDWAREDESTRGPGRSVTLRPTNALLRERGVIRG